MYMYKNNNYKVSVACSVLSIATILRHLSRVNRPVAILDPTVEGVVLDNSGKAIGTTSVAVLFEFVRAKAAVGARALWVLDMEDRLAGVDEGLHLGALCPINTLLIYCEVHHVHHILYDGQRILEADGHAVACCLLRHPPNQVY